MTIDYDPTRSALYTPEQRDTIFQAGKSYTERQLAVEAARLAYFRTEESTAERVRLAAALSRVGFSDLALFVDTPTGAQAFAARRLVDGVTLLAIRGTQPDDISDIGTDLRATLVAWPESAGQVHAGFARATRALVPQIGKWVQITRPDLSMLILTGHSLGAAMATLIATIWRPGWLVTLGSPRVGDADFVETVVPSNSVRMVDCCDVVTQLPPPIGGYTHLRTCTYLTGDGAILEDPPQQAIDADRVRARLEYLAHFAWKIGNVAVRDLADHAPINYARALFS